ncbi:MAG: PAS domain S-box protein [Chloroflexi bacterium]|nr:PAS domain S-box protein [Chloroflexota bacterium]
MARDVELTVIRRDGTRVPVSMNFSMAKSSEGEQLLVTVARDISQRKQAEEALRQSEERYRSLFDNAQVGLFRTSLGNGRALEANHLMATLFGYDSRQQFLSEFVATEHYVDPGLRNRIIEELRRSGQVKSYEVLMRRRDGSRMWVNCSVRVYPQTDSAEGALVDTTRAKQAEESLREAQATLERRVQERTVELTEANDRLRQEMAQRLTAEKTIEHLNSVLRAIRNVNQIIVREKDRDRMLQSACDSLTRSRGYHHAWIALADESGRLTAIAGAGLGKSQKALSAYLKRGQLPHCAAKALQQSGAVVSSAPLSSCSDCPLLPQYRDRIAMTTRLECRGRVYGVLAVSLPAKFGTSEEEQLLFQEVASDIALALHSMEQEDKRLQAEQALKDYSQRLEESTRELRSAQQKLVRHEKLAVLGQLAGGVGHELRNPLGAIKNAAYFLNMVLQNPEPEIKETLEILGREVAASERIISSLLDFARPRQPVLQKANINGLVEEALAKVKVPHDVELATELDRSLPPVLADPGQVGLVLGNIILNAIQAMPDGGRLVIRSASAPPDHVAISVSDTGVGISEENLTRLFQPLFTSKAKGIGLGLAVSKTLLETHGGSIEVQSKEGQGSSFTVRLPLGGELQK